MKVPLKTAELFWEIKLAWSEYRNGKWTQKQVSGEAIYDKVLRSIHAYQFVPRIATSPNQRVVVDVLGAGLNGKLGAFQFVGSQLSLSNVLGDHLDLTDFHYVPDVFPNPTNIYSLQAREAAPPQNFGKETLLHREHNQCDV